jgi:glycosyltransferase involved in cell wall biosynthesis
MEAMAMGATVLTTGLGALPETLAGFGHMVPPSNDSTALARAFASMACETLKDMRLNRDKAAFRRETQIAYVRQHYTWPPRALEWQNWLFELIAGK